MLWEQRNFILHRLRVLEALFSRRKMSRLQHNAIHASGAESEAAIPEPAGLNFLSIWVCSFGNSCGDHGSQSSRIPSKYNTSGTSGVEVDVPVDQSKIEFNIDVKSK
jgi:hypothetical protein